MSRVSVFNSPLLLGFEHFERALDRISKVSSDGYPPYNIERTGEDRLRITLAVAGFTQDDLTVSVEENQLTVHGKRVEDDGREYLHRGIAARQFQRAFLLAEGIEVTAAALANGGSLSDVGPGIGLFASIKKAGNWLPVDASPQTVASGQTPIARGAARSATACTRGSRTAWITAIAPPRL